MRNTITLLLFAVIISQTYSVYIKLPHTKAVGKDTVHSHNKRNRHHYSRESRATVNDDQQYVNLRISAYKTNEAQSKKRISVGVSPDAEQGFNSSAANDVYETKLTYRPGPDFYADIFKIPISLLQAVSNFLVNNVAYINSTTIQAITPAQSGTRPISLSILPQSSLTSSEAIDLSSSSPEAEHLSSTLPEILESPSSKL